MNKSKKENFSEESGRVTPFTASLLGKSIVDNMLAEAEYMNKMGISRKIIPRFDDKGDEIDPIIFFPMFKTK